MNIISTEIEDVKIIEPKLFGDERGYFMETYSEKIFNTKGQDIKFVQDNESMSEYGVLRGLHYQLPPYAQSKLVRVIQGRVLDIAVDIRKGSPTFAKHVAIELSGENKLQMFIPKGFAHGFVVLSETLLFVYKCDNYYAPEHQRGIRFDDPSLNIDWQLDPKDLLLSPKDIDASSFADAELFNYSENL
ncbi:MAG: dTDP-4-dehydrorhamnose 3,5-epimerase [Victivallales bacterium]|nr:dTDP-4-dehydrorhamnose 3,5-epimerase [Victivallales bacterium]